MRIARCTFWILLPFISVGCVFGEGGSSPIEGEAAGNCGCRTPSTRTQPAPDLRNAPRGGKVVIALESEPGILLPQYSTHPAIAEIISTDVMEALVSANPRSGEIQPVLADSWQIDENGTKLVFALHPGVTWHDGAPFSAGDVVFTFNQITDPAGGTVLETLFRDVASVEAPDALTVVFQLDSPRDDFVAALSRAIILPSHLFENTAIPSHPAARAPIGTGPFQFSQWKKGQSIVLKRARHYRGTPVLLDEVEYRIIKDPQIARAGLLSGELDILSHSDSWQPSGEYISQTAEDDSFAAWTYNTRSPLFSDAATRRALDALIDRQTVRCAVLQCRAVLLSSPWWSDPAPETSAPYSRKTGRTLLEGAGWRDVDDDGILERGGVKFEVELLMADPDRNEQRTALLIQHDLDKAGIRMRLVEVSPAVFSKRLSTGEFDIAQVSVDSSIPFNPEVLFPEPLPPELTQQQIIEKLHAQMPMSFLARPLRTVVTRPEIGGLYLRGATLEKRYLFRHTSLENRP